jgi:hypothetical protein
MTALVQQRCQFHHFREAVARCPGCGRYFCRECVTEHEDRMICASCLRQMTAKTSGASRAVWRVIGRIALGGAGVMLAWAWFYILGRCLLNMPSNFHEGSVWVNMM